MVRNQWRLPPHAELKVSSRSQAPAATSSPDAAESATALGTKKRTFGLRLWVVLGRGTSWRRAARSGWSGDQAIASNAWGSPPWACKRGKRSVA